MYILYTNIRIFNKLLIFSGWYTCATPFAKLSSKPRRTELHKRPRYATARQSAPVKVFVKVFAKVFVKCVRKGCSIRTRTPRRTPIRTPRRTHSCCCLSFRPKFSCFLNFEKYCLNFFEN